MDQPIGLTSKVCTGPIYSCRKLLESCVILWIFINFLIYKCMHIYYPVKSNKASGSNMMQYDRREACERNRTNRA